MSNIHPDLIVVFIISLIVTALWVIWIIRSNILKKRLDEANALNLALSTKIKEMRVMELSSKLADGVGKITALLEATPKISKIVKWEEK